METDIKVQLNRIEKLTLLSAKNVLCLNDVVLLTGLSKSHIYKMTHSRKITFYKPNGKQIYFDRSEIENWMKQNRVATTDEIETEAVNYIVTGKIQKGAQRGKSIH